jgi:hypothetical protein
MKDRSWILSWESRLVLHSFSVVAVGLAHSPPKGDDPPSHEQRALGRLAGLQAWVSVISGFPWDSHCAGTASRSSCSVRDSRGRFLGRCNDPFRIVSDEICRREMTANRYLHNFWTRLQRAQWIITHLGCLFAYRTMRISAVTGDIDQTPSRLVGTTLTDHLSLRLWFNFNSSVNPLMFRSSNQRQWREMCFLHTCDTNGRQFLVFVDCADR